MRIAYEPNVFCDGVGETKCDEIFVMEPTSAVPVTDEEVYKAAEEQGWTFMHRFLFCPKCTKTIVT